MKNILLKYKIYILIIGILFSPFLVSAQVISKCSPKGYTIFTINGIFTSRQEAKENRDRLMDHLNDIYNHQPLTVGYLYNPTHLAGIGDIIDSVAQGLFNEKSDYDLTEMLKDASEKVRTQKVLLVAHSQGNFYANNFYDKVANKVGGIPSQSIGVYSVATPTNHVAGGGKYLTSDTDKVIIALVSHLIKVLPPNIHIVLKDKNSLGHDFSKVYLNYESDRIVSDIHSSLDKLKNNKVQDSKQPCIAPPKLTISHKIVGVAYHFYDSKVETIKDGVVIAYDIGKYVADKVDKGTLLLAKIIRKNLLASAIGNLPNVNNLAVAPTTSQKVLSVTGVNLIDKIVPIVQKNQQKKIEKKILQKIKKIIEPKIIAKKKIEKVKTKIEIKPKKIKVEVPPVLVVPEPTKVIPPTIYYGGGGGGASSTISTPNPTPTPVIIPDTTPPVVTIIGDDFIKIMKGDIYSDAGATAIDDVDGDITGKIIKGGDTVDTAILGTYVINYNISDSAGNSSTVSRTVNVLSPYPDLIIDKDITLPAGEYFYNNLTIKNNAVLTMDSDLLSTNSFKGVKLNVNNLTISSGSSISADAKGYKKGPGTSSLAQSGGTYGGDGYANTDNLRYGSATKPTDLGSGGIVAFAGGGAIRIIVSDTLQNDGIISAGGSSNSSGGSIYVTTKNLTGSGKYQANGGGLYVTGNFYMPGGGGRIALYYQNSTFTGTAKAKGGCGSPSGSLDCGKNGTVGFFDTTNNNLLINSSWQFRKTDSPFNFNEIKMTNGAEVESDDGVNINANDLLIDEASTFTLAGGEIFNIKNKMILTKKSILTVVPEKILSLTIPNISIDDTSSISADGKGYKKGPGSPDVVLKSGASYGGKGGGIAAKPVYGLANAPVDFGSGNGGDRGGGAIRIIVSDTLQNDGIISAGGSSNSSGGSIYVTADKVDGHGIFRVNSGGVYWTNGTAGGGGGRIAIHYKKLSFTGTTAALAGIYCNSGCNPAGEKGTIEKIDDTIPILSSEKKITSFNFSALLPEVIGTVNEIDHTIALSVPYGTDITTLIPTIIISSSSSVNPRTDTPQDFTNPITYTVTAEDGSAVNYKITVVVEPNPNLATSNTTLPVIKSYTFDGKEGDIIVNPTKDKPMTLSLTSSENVNWMSIKIEREADKSFYRMYQSGTNCVDGTDSCTKVWNGELSKGGLLKDGKYKVKVHIKDSEGNEFYDYLSFIITVDSSI